MIYQALKTWFQTYGVMLKLLMINMRYGVSHIRENNVSPSYARGRQSRGDVYSTKRILAVTHVKVMRKHGYGYLEEIVVRRADNVLYRFKEVMAPVNHVLSSSRPYKNIDMEYLPKRRWSTLEKKRVNFMIKDINKLLKERMMMRSLEKFVAEHDEFDESDTHVLERFNTSAGNPVKDILLKLNLPDHRILKDGGKGATLKLFKSTNQERCSRSHSRQAKDQAQDLKSTITTTNHKLMIEVKDYELKTKVEA
ncbi:hypothetical protein Tco_0261496 [Tanacetum coccineum]